MKSSISFCLAWTSFQLEFVSIFHLFLSLVILPKTSKRIFASHLRYSCLKTSSSIFLTHNSPFYLLKGLGVRVFFLPNKPKKQCVELFNIRWRYKCLHIEDYLRQKKGLYSTNFTHYATVSFYQVTMVRCMFSIRSNQLSISDAGIELIK